MLRCIAIVVSLALQTTAFAAGDFFKVDCNVIGNGQAGKYMELLLSYSQKESEHLLNFAQVVEQFSSSMGEEHVINLLKTAAFVKGEGEKAFYDPVAVFLQINEAQVAVATQADQQALLGNFVKTLESLEQKGFLKSHGLFQDNVAERADLLLGESHFSGILDNEGRIAADAETRNPALYQEWKDAKLKVDASVMNLLQDYEAYLDTFAASFVMLENHIGANPAAFEGKTHMIEAAALKIAVFYESVVTSFKNELVHRFDSFPIRTASRANRLFNHMQSIKIDSRYPGKLDKEIYENVAAMTSEWAPGFLDEIEAARSGLR